MESIFGFVVMIILALGGGNGDLLDTMSCNAYWKARGITPTAEVMRAAANPGVATADDVSADIEKLGSGEFSVRTAARKALEAKGPEITEQLKKGMQSKDPEVATTCKEILGRLGTTGQAGAVKKLMAIRTLGEMKDKGAVDLLKSLATSKEMFVADYATRSLDEISGESHPGKRESIDGDIQLMPADTGIVAQIRCGKSGEFLTLETLVTRYRMSQAMPMELVRTAVESRKALIEVTKKLTGLTDQTGNFRLDGVTFGVAKDVGETGWAIGLVRGLYDHEAALAAIKRQGGEITEQDGMSMVKIGAGQAYLLLPSDNVMVIITGSGEASIGPARSEIIKALKTGKGEFGQNAEMAGVLKKVDTSKDIWAAMQLNAQMREAPFLRPFDVLTLQVNREDGVLKYEISGTGDDVAKVKEAVNTIKAEIKSSLDELKGMLADGGPEAVMARTGSKLMNGMNFAVNDKSATLTGTLEPVSTLIGMMGTFGGELEMLLNGDEEVEPGIEGGGGPPGMPQVDPVPPMPPRPMLR